MPDAREPAPSPTGNPGAEPSPEPAKLWCAALDGADPGDLGSLSPDERERAGRYRHPRDRARFVAARRALRAILATELGCAPSELVFAVDPEHGKPRVEGAALHFSASRSGGVALYATSRTAEIGVDVEAIRPGTDLRALARRCFTAAERASLDALGADGDAARTAAAFACWTRKEAYGKALGTGLDYPLRTVDVWAGDDRPTTAGRWAVHAVSVQPGMAAAVAVVADTGWTPGSPLKIGL